MAAVRRAAIELLAEHGPAAVSIRGIARRAGVNHALLHRHFGTRDDLLRAVLASHSAVIGDAARARPGLRVPDALRLLDEHSAYWRALARTVLDEPELLVSSGFPAARAFLGLLTDGDPDTEHREAAAVTGALALGWLLFGPHLARALDLRHDDLRPQFVAAIQRLLS